MLRLLPTLTASAAPPVTSCVQPKVWTVTPSPQPSQTTPGQALTADYSAVPGLLCPLRPTHTDRGCRHSGTVSSLSFSLV